MENLLTAQNLLLLLLVIAASYYIYLRAFVYNKIKRVEKEFTIYFKKGATEKEIEVVRLELEKKFKTDFIIIEQKDSRYAQSAVKGPFPPPPPPPVIHPDYIKKAFIWYNKLPILSQKVIHSIEIKSNYSVSQV